MPALRLYNGVGLLSALFVGRSHGYALLALCRKDGEVSAFQILIRELARGGGQTTYVTLQRRHPTHDYTDFVHAVYKARRLGLVTRDRGRGKPIVATGCCPTCGRVLNTKE